MPGPTFLDGDRVTLHPIESEDVDFLQRCWNDPDVWRYALDPNPITRDQQADHYENSIATTDGVHCLVCDGDERLGVVSLTESLYGPGDTDRSRAAELAYWFAPEHHGEGYAKDSAETTIEYAFEDRNLRRLSARCGSFNEASAGLLESLGFEREGTLRQATWFRGDYHDLYWYGLLRDEWRTRNR